MKFLEPLLVEYGWRIGAGVTVLLGIGCVGVFLTRSPLRRQRICEGTFAAVLAWLGLCFLPTSDWLPTMPGLNRISDWIGPSDSSSTKMNLRSPNRFDRTLFENAPLQNAATPADKGAAAYEVTSSAPGKDLPTLFDGAGVDAFSSNLSSTYEIVTAIYLSGALLVSAALIWGRWTLYRWVRRSKSPRDWLRELWSTESKVGAAKLTANRHRWFACRVAAPPRLRMSPDCGRPICFGVLRPTILIPDSMANMGFQKELPHVLRHELAHIRHGDAWGRLLGNVLLQFCYCHPLYWWLRCAMNEAAERRADDCAARQTDAVEYVAAVTQFVRSFPPRPAVAFATAGILGSKSSFYRRMNMLLSSKSALERSTPIWWKLTAIGVAGSTLIASASALQSPKNRDDTARSEAAAAREAVAGLNEKREAALAAEKAALEPWPKNNAKSLTKLDALGVQLSKRQRLEVETESLKLLQNLAELKARLGDEHPELVAQRRRLETLAALLRSPATSGEPSAQVPSSKPAKAPEKIGRSSVEDAMTKKVADVAATEADLKSLQKMLELEKARIQLRELNQNQLIQEQVANKERLDALLRQQVAELAAQQQKAKSRGLADEARKAASADRFAELEMQIARLTDVIEVGKKERQALMDQIKQLTGESIARRDPGSFKRFAPLDGSASVAMLKHQLRMAKAGLDVSKAEFHIFESKFESAKAQMQSRQISREQFQETLANLEHAQARLKFAAAEIESLEMAIKESEQERSRQPGTPARTAAP